MKNTILTQSKIRTSLQAVITVLIIFCIMMVFMLVSFKQVGDITLSGETAEVTGVITKIDGSEVTLDNGKEYNVVCDKVEMNDYLNKEVTLITPLETYSSNPWILGLVVNGETLVNAQENLAEHKESNDSGILASAVITGVLAVALCVVIVWFINSKRVEEKPLLHAYCETFAQRQPGSPSTKSTAIAIIVWLVLITALTIITPFVASDAETAEYMTATDFILLGLWLVVFFGGLIPFIVLTKIAFRKEVEMYAEKFPFDFTDITHIRMKKAMKEQLQKDLIADREKHPHLYGDGGNGYDVTFEQGGVVLTPPFYEDELPETEDKTEYIFSDMPKNETSSEVFEGMGAPIEKPNAIRLSYERLNFEAVAHYRRNTKPLMVVIKSRIADNSDLPQEFQNDLHLLLDVHLLKTLQTFNVPVENLQYILDNKFQLMKENCFGRKKQK